MSRRINPDRQPPLSNREIQVYTFIKEKIAEDQIPPTIREICEGIGARSTSTVHAQLQNLEARGLIKTRERSSRAIRIIANPEDLNIINPRSKGVVLV